MGRELKVIGQKPRQPKPEWLKIRLGDPTNQNHVLKLIERKPAQPKPYEAVPYFWTDLYDVVASAAAQLRHCSLRGIGER